MTEIRKMFQILLCCIKNNFEERSLYMIVSRKLQALELDFLTFRKFNLCLQQIISFREIIDNN